MYHDKRRGTFRVQWMHQGVRRSKSFRCEKRARIFELELQTGEVDAAPAPRVQPTFKAFAERWLRDYSQVSTRGSTHDENRRVVKRHLTAAFGARRLDQLARADLLAFRAELHKTKAKGRKTTLKPKTVNNVLQVAKEIMGYAVELEMLAANPWARVKLLKVPKPTFKFWQPVERERFYERAVRDRPDLAALAYLACHTGMRKGELRGLAWRAVDFERRKVAVRVAFSARTGELDRTKNGKEEDVPLNDAAVAVLRRLEAGRSGPTVFSPQLFQNLRRDFRALCQRAGVPVIRFHDTRHTFASCLALAGVDLRRIMELLRVSDYKMVLRYAHLLPSHLVGATDVLCTQTARKEAAGKVSIGKSLKLKRTLSDSNARPSGSKPVAVGF